MTKTAIALIIAVYFTLPAFASGTSSCTTADTKCTSSCPSNVSSNTTCSSSTCSSNASTSTCSSGTNQDSCSSSVGESVERSEAADRALLDTTTGNLEQSRKLLDMSSNLLQASRGIDGIEGLDNVYINAMLHLADDIAIMSERTAKSADKVIEMDDQNEKDLNQAVTASDMILRNNIKIQQNLLEAQQNFNDVLVTLNQ